MRDLNGDLVVSHDPPAGRPLTLAELLAEWDADGAGTTLALNIKSDGLAPGLIAASVGRDMSRHFVFDMSVPDMVAWVTNPDVNVPVFARWSDLERRPVVTDKMAGLWLDAFFDDDWWSENDLVQRLDSGLSVSVVSPELHGRDPGEVWDRLRSSGLHTRPELFLCTDDPELAERFFQ